MENKVASNPIQKSEYWDLITSTLSSYEVKEISRDGKVITELVYDDYFLVSDSWNVNDIGIIPNFKEQFKKYTQKRKNVNFTSENHNFALELKYVMFHRLFNDEIGLRVFFSKYSGYIYRIILFLNEKYPKLQSLLDLDVDEAEKKWIWWLNNNGLKTTRKSHHYKYGGREIRSKLANFFRAVYEQLFTLTDKREEWEKDRWDVRVLNAKYGVEYNRSTTDFFVDFMKIENTVFRQYFKKYLHTRLLGGGRFSWGTARKYSIYVPRFLNFISEIEPQWNDLKGLTRQHIESYLNYLRDYSINELKQKNANPKQNRSDNIKCVYTFLKDIQRFEYSIASEKSTSLLLYPEDYPSLDKKSDDVIEYIPDSVLEQLFGNINELNPDVQPVVWVAYKTGLRISDVLGLTQDCLVRLNGKYSIVTDIEKVYVKGHRIPIDEELANMLAVVIHNSKEFSNDDNNPNKYIFVRYKGFRKGLPYAQGWISDKLNELAIKKNITDEMGNLFHFKNHQFRHTYAVKLLNGGADILTVQELLAHASPEMTLRYARLLDDTKRKEFEKVIKQGVFTFDLNGEIHE